MVNTDVVELPAPNDDGAAAHLTGQRLPPIPLPATDGRSLRLDSLPTRSVIFVYPAMGGPGRDDQLRDWTATPGARGCTPEACSFRDELAGFRAAGIEVFGLSSQDRGTQRKYATELRLPYPLVSDERFQLAVLPGLPTFDFHGRRYYRRLTLLAADGAIEAALYPVFPPDEAASQALGWLSEHGLRDPGGPQKPAS